MLIKITKSHNRAYDPRTVEFLNKDLIRDFEDEIALDIIKNGFGIEIKKQKEVIENKAIFEIAENKENAEVIIEEKAKKKK